MTATPRIYAERSKKTLKSRGIDVIDMTDTRVYGPELHRLSFRDAVKQEMLSDYRVIVLGVRQGTVTKALREHLEKLDEARGLEEAAEARRHDPRARGVPRSQRTHRSGRERGRAR